ncbi:MAG TPA: tetratricopeptide repeat protein [Trueperaceae bacterium]
MTHGSHVLRRAGLAVRELMLLVAVATALSMAGAQELPENAAEALERGEALVEEALSTYEAQYPDRPLWRQAFAEGRTAIDLAPGHPEPLRFLARAYSLSNWHGPAVQAWRDYLDAGGELEGEDAELFARSANEYAFAAYQVGDRELAAERYEDIVEVQPDNVEAHRWLGRILLELRMPEPAVAAWRTVLELDPDSPGAEYFLELAQAQARWGVDAANSFYAGVTAYESGDLTRARNSFAAATARNADYAEAWAWLGRVYFEQGLYADANVAYERAVALAPGEPAYQWFARESARLMQGGGEPAEGAPELEAPPAAPEGEDALPGAGDDAGDDGNAGAEDDAEGD